MKRREFIKHLIKWGGTVGVYVEILSSRLLTFSDGAAPNIVQAKAADYYRIVVLGDPHLPVRERENPNLTDREWIIKAKNKVLDDINSWDDVGQITVVGDIAAQFANDEEYAYAKQYFGRFQMPVFFITGNHDYIYTNSFLPDRRFVNGDADSRRQKLRRFQETWGMPELFYTQKHGNYLLVYLSVDSLETKNLAEMSKQQLDWLRETLKANPDTPTILFFHGPLKGTLTNNTSRVANTAQFIAQPEEEIHNIISNNKQILLWVSGHTHTAATNPDFASPVNLYEGRVNNIHNADMDRKVIWTNSLYLYPDKIVIKTFNHGTGLWMDELERMIAVPVK